MKRKRGKFPLAMCLATTLVVLNLADAMLTLVAISKGATEANPLMAYLLAHSPWAFLLTKYFLVMIGTTVLVQVRALRALASACVFYAAVVVWHLLHV